MADQLEFSFATSSKHRIRCEKVRAMNRSAKWIVPYIFSKVCTSDRQKTNRHGRSNDANIHIFDVKISVSRPFRTSPLK
jgi:hypothetical protein